MAKEDHDGLRVPYERIYGLRHRIPCRALSESGGKDTQRNGAVFRARAG